MITKSRKAGCLDMNIHLTRKQRIMWNRLNDGQWKEVLFYGASRSGKTFVILYWLIVQCVAHKANCLVLRNLFTSLQTGMLQQTLPAVLNAIAKHNGYAKWQEITMKDGTPFAKYNGKDNYLHVLQRRLHKISAPYAGRPTTRASSIRFFRRNGVISSSTRYRRSRRGR